MSANAAAGAIAGTLVSITLHPVDTIKVTIQAERNAREPLMKVIARMLSKRGVLGLYSGLTTSLASSAPISAIYTASYESVKGKLLLIFPEVRHSTRPPRRSTYGSTRRALRSVFCPVCFM